jgi:hypothetical protein
MFAAASERELSLLAIYRMKTREINVTAARGGSGSHLAPASHSNTRWRDQDLAGPGKPPPTRRTQSMEYHAIIERVRSEFLEMPGLRLTPAQAARLWNVDAATCQHVITALVGSAFLRWTPRGTVMRVEN